jgi:hypothetical protein
VSDYLDRLEAELVRAGFRERRRRVPVAPLVGACAVVLVALGLIYAPQGDERVAAPPGSVDAEVIGVSVLDSMPATLRVGIRVGEPVTVDVTAGSVTKTAEIGGGTEYLNLTPADGEASEVTVRITDDDGNVRTFERAVAAKPPLSENFGVLRGEPVEEPLLIRDGLIPRDAVGADPVTYEAYSSPQRGDAWVVVGDKQLCAIYYGPTDATLWGCFAPGRELANGLVEPIENRRNSVIALVPDGTRDARALSVDGTERELEIINNVLVAFDVQPDTVSWTTPKGQAVGFGGQTWPADVGVDLAPRFSVVDPANAVPPESVEPPLPAEFDPVEVYDAGPIARGVEAQVVVAEDIVCVAARFVGATALPCWPRDEALLEGRERVSEGLAVALLPDDAASAWAVYRDGRREPVEIVDNVVIAPGAIRIEWSRPRRP